MGAKAKRLARLKAEHPVCYFCATAATETIDHVPSRECFKERIGPEGYEFPACKRCNHGASQIEQVVAFYLLLANQADEEPSAEQLRRLFLGLRNNNPELMPSFELNSRAAREFFRETSRKLDPGSTFAETPLLSLPEGYRAAFNLFARRLVCALHYREVGRPVLPDQYIAVAWLPWQHPTAAEVVEQGRKLFPRLTFTNRSNTNIGDQFRYLWGYKEEEGLFGCLSQFSRSFLIMGGVVSSYLEGRTEHWVQHREDLLLR